MTKSIANNSSLRPLGETISSRIGSDLKKKIPFTSVSQFEEPKRKLTLEESARIQKIYPYSTRKDLIEIYTKYLTLAELTARKNQLEKSSIQTSQKGKMITATPGSTTNKFSMQTFKSTTVKTKVIEKEKKFDPTQVTLDDIVEVELLCEFVDFFKVRSPRARSLIIRASNIISDPANIISWDNFLNLNIVVLLGKGTKEQKINFLEKLFCPSTVRGIPKQDFLTILRDILAPNQKLNGVEVDVNETVENIWRSDFLPSGCVKNNNILIPENFRKAMECDKIFTDVFMQLINEDIIMNPSLPTNDY